MCLQAGIASSKHYIIDLVFMVYDDPMKAMHQLRQTRSVLEYKALFEVISNKVKGVREE